MRRRRRRWVVGGLLLAVVAVAAWGGLLAWQAYAAYGHLRTAEDQITQLQAQVASGDAQATRATTEELREETAAARDAVHGPHWSVAAALPVVGRNVSAVQKVTEALDDVASGTADDLAEVTGVVDPADLLPVEGRIRLAPIRQATPHVAAIHEVVADADAHLADIDVAGLVGPLRGPVGDLVDTVDQLAYVTGAVATAGELMPSMLGADGPRHYLLLEQNNAEPRALGGYAGAVVLLRADDGRIELVQQRTGGSFGELARPALELTPAERALYGTQLARFMGNVTATPDFPRAARLAREIWRRDTGRTVDGVASIDPYTLQQVLAATGPVTMPDGREVGGDNAVQVLLNDVYKDILIRREQDEFFAQAAAAAFAKVVSGAGDRSGTAEALSDAAQQGRLMLWSSRPAEQKVIAGTAVSGVLRGSKGDAPLVGVYLHDRSAAKIAYYEQVRVVAEPTVCDSDGVRRLDVTVTLRSDAPADAASLPPVLTGGGRAVKPGSVRTEVYVYAPEGGMVEGFDAAVGPDLVRTYVHDGLHVATHEVTLAPGGTAELTFDVSVPPRLHGDAQLRVTPGPTDGQFAGSVTTCAGAVTSE